MFYSGSYDMAASSPQQSTEYFFFNEEGERLKEFEWRMRIAIDVE